MLTIQVYCSVCHKGHDAYMRHWLLKGEQLLLNLGINLNITTILGWGWWW